MSDETPRPMCFVAMPFGRKAPPGKERPLIDFDAIYEHIERAAGQEGLECVRADFEAGGGFIHKPMYERLLVAEYVIADVTFSNPNVMYEIGVRHGASGRATILLCARDHVGALPFDLKPLRVLPYGLDEDGTIGGADAEELAEGLRDRIRLARGGKLPSDNPILQITAWHPRGRVHHEKTDVFLERVEFAGEIGERIAAALRAADAGAAIDRLEELEAELLGAPEVVRQLHSALLGIYLGYRERKAYGRMVAMFERLPGELRQTPVAREQYALALNRLAEQAETRGERAEAAELRGRALRALDQIAPEAITSETHGIRGRIYKGLSVAEEKAGNDAKSRAMLQRAIETYEEGLRADCRDYYPGVNAVTLRLRRGTPEDLEAVRRLAPVVRFAVENAPEAEDEEERYWRAATKLELAALEADWHAADARMTDLLAIDARDWMRETTAGNLGILKAAFADDPHAIERIERLMQALES